MRRRDVSRTSDQPINRTWVCHLVPRSGLVLLQSFRKSINRVESLNALYSLRNNDIRPHPQSVPSLLCSPRPGRPLLPRLWPRRAAQSQPLSRLLRAGAAEPKQLRRPAAAHPHPRPPLLPGLWPPRGSRAPPCPSPAARGVAGNSAHHPLPLLSCPHPPHPLLAVKVQLPGGRALARAASRRARAAGAGL